MYRPFQVRFWSCCSMSCHVRCMCHVKSAMSCQLALAWLCGIWGSYTPWSCVPTERSTAAGNVHWPPWEEPRSEKVTWKERSDVVQRSCRDSTQPNMKNYCYRFGQTREAFFRVKLLYFSSSFCSEDQIQGNINNVTNLQYPHIVSVVLPVTLPLWSLWGAAAFGTTTQSLWPHCTLLPTGAGSEGKPSALQWATNSFHCLAAQHSVASHAHIVGPGCWGQQGTAAVGGWFSPSSLGKTILHTCTAADDHLYAHKWSCLH